jgi:hypothetical protein
MSGFASTVSVGRRLRWWIVVLAAVAAVPFAGRGVRLRRGGRRRVLSGTAPAPSGSGITVTGLARATVPALVFVAWLVATRPTVRIDEPSPANCPF